MSVTARSSNAPMSRGKSKSGVSIPEISCPGVEYPVRGVEYPVRGVL